MAGRRGTIFLLFGAMAWILAAAAASVLAAVLPGLVWVVSGLTWPGLIPEPSRLVYVLVGALGFQAALLLAALRQGRRGAGLGMMQVRRKGLIAGLCVAMIGWLVLLTGLSAMIPWLRDFMRSVTSDLLSGVGASGLPMWLLRATVLAVMAPLSEEFFFRGWLWEASRARGHGTAATVVMTGLPWLLLHGIDAPGRILFLFPAAAILTIARDRGGSVGASLLVHAVNNGAVVFFQTIASFADPD